LENRYGIPLVGYWEAHDFNNTKSETFLKVRPDRVAFNEKTKVCTFLEFTRPTDSRDGASKQPDWYTWADWFLDWAQDKDLEKNTSFSRHLEYIWWHHGEGEELGQQPNTTVPWESEAPQLRQPGRTTFRN